MAYAGEYGLRVVGIGPGGKDYILPAALKIIETAKVLAGGKRALAAFAHAGQKTISITGNISSTLAVIDQVLTEHEVTVMVSGDPGYHSLLPTLEKHFGDRIIQVIPGLSSLQLAFAKAKLPWQEAKLLSLHGREPQDAELIYKPGRLLGALTDNRYNSQTIAKRLLQNAWPPSATCHIAVRLSYPDEKIIVTDLREAAANEGISHGVIIVNDMTRHKKPIGDNNNKTKYLGLADDDFVRGEIPMTKQEVRIVTITKAHIEPMSVVYDVGAGTGALTIEAAGQAYAGEVYAWEKNPVGAKLIRANAEKFGVSNVQILLREAPDGMEELPPADAVIIGGSGGRLPEILAAVDKKLKDGGRIVLNFIALQNLVKAIEYMRKHDHYTYEVIQLQVSRLRRVGAYDMSEGLNPVHIMTCIKEKN